MKLSGSAHALLFTECGPPVAIENGQSSGLTGLLVGDTVTYSCDAGYELTLSEPTITCQIFGTWETAPGCRISKYK